MGDLETPVYDDLNFSEMSVKATDFIKRFFVFCPNFGKKEGEEEKKLLFYYPIEVELEKKLRAIGFTEAFCRFTLTFTGGDQPFVEISTTKDFEVSSEVEKGYYIAIVCDSKLASEAKYALRGKVLHQMLRMLYSTFRLFFGNFENHVTRSGDQIDSSALKKRLLYFCPRYLNLLRLHIWPLMNLIEGVNYMPLDTTNCLKMHSLINRVIEEFPSVRYTMFLCNSRLMWHLTPKSDLVVLYKYLTEFLLPRSFRNEIQPESRRESTSSYSFSSHGKFISGPSFIFSDGSNDFGNVPNRPPPPFWAPKVYIHSKEKDGDQEALEEHFLVVYRHLNATLVVLVPAWEPSMETGDFFSRMDLCVGSLMTDMAPGLVEIFTKVQTDDANRAVSFPYLYYNSVNSHMIYSLGDPTASTTPPLALTSSAVPVNNPPPYELYGVLCDLSDEMNKSSYFGNVIAKAEGDYWLVAKKAESREIYALVSRKNVTMIEINEEINKLCSQHFENEFLLE